MKTIKNTLAGIVLATSLAISGCSDSINNNSKIKPISISGKPISVQQSTSHSTDHMATVLEVDGKYVLASTGNVYDSNNCVESATLIQSEIDDGDDEKISLKGNYIDKKFYLNEVTANGYTIKFR